MAEHTPLPWELCAASKHHGPYIVGCYGSTICDLYAMSNPMAASVRNGGDSYPIAFTDADANAAFIIKACNAHDALVAALEDASAFMQGVMQERGDSGVSILIKAASAALAKALA